MSTPLRDQPPATEAPRVVARTEPAAGESQPRLGLAASIVILSCLVVFVVAGLSIPSGDFDAVDDGGRSTAAAIVAVAAFTVAVITFALGTLRRR